MRLLTALERFFERLFERPSARLFRTRLQPVHLQRRIERAMEAQRLSGAGRTFVPNRFSVRLHPADFATFEDIAASLAAELADGALAFARGRQYALVDRPRVDLVSDAEIERGDIGVVAQFADPEDRPVDPAGAGAQFGDGTHGGLADRTMVFTMPTVESPLAVLREVRTDGSQREIAVDGRLMSIGRASDNTVVLNDGRVSRYHARLQARRGTLVFTDLGSTNGSLVNGVPVREVVLGEGDRIELGDTVLIVESVSAA